MSCPSVIRKTVLLMILCEVFNKLVSGSVEVSELVKILLPLVLLLSILEDTVVERMVDMPFVELFVGTKLSVLADALVTRLVAKLIDVKLDE